MIPKLPLSNLRSRLRLVAQLRPLTTTANSGKAAAAAAAKAEGVEDDGGVVSREEAYRRVNDLDFMTAVKILVTTPPKRKKFGFDFHLVQFFFACLPSLAVYLVAQYARYDIRKMEAEAEVKKKQAEEAEEKAKEEVKAKEAELLPDPDISKVIVRLDALEEVVKEIVDDKKRTGSTSKNDQADGKDSSDPQVRPKSGDLKTDDSSKKETISGSSLSIGVPSGDSQNNKGADR